MSVSKTYIEWNGGNDPRALEVLRRTGGVIVSPTKVGYIIMTTNSKGLNRKFDIKDRPRNKPGVILCGSMEQLKELAILNDEIINFYQDHWDRDILLGCILPWSKTGKKYIPDDGSHEYIMDRRETSCFVIRFGTPSEKLARALWEENNTLAFASSANPSGKGNRGMVSGIGKKIEAGVDFIIGADNYVASIQPDKNKENRYEQGVMVSMVDQEGNLLPEQKNARGVLPAPTLIRKGLDNDKIIKLLCDHFNTWDYRQGSYY